jgi:uncharacterized protein
VTLPADPLFYIVAVLAIALVGMAKGGFAGLGAASMPMLALVMDPIRAAAMLLPILMVQDAVSVWAFRKSYDTRTLLWMVPGAAVGIGLGWAFAASVNADAIRAAVGIIAVAFGLYRLIGFGANTPRVLPQWVGSLWGGVAGFTSQIAHAGGPPFQIWAMTRGFPHTVFIGTSSIFFAIINCLKVPAYFALGQFTWNNMQLTLIFLPVAILSTMAGVHLVKRLDPDRFFSIISVLMVAVGGTLLWTSLT